MRKGGGISCQGRRKGETKAAQERPKSGREQAKSTPTAPHARAAKSSKKSRKKRERSTVAKRVAIIHENVKIKAKNLEPSYLHYRVGGMRL